MDSSKLRFRNLKPDEYAVLIGIWQKAGLLFRPQGRDAEAKLLAELKNNNSCFILAEYEDKAIGSILATHDGRKGWLNRLAVIPEFRGSGIAEKLIEQAENYLKEKNILIFACLIEEWNTTSIALFRKYGYQLNKDIIYLTKKQHPEV